jgi:hypothetical protein
MGTEFKLISCTKLQKSKPVSQYTEDNYIILFVKTQMVEMFMRVLDSA